MEDVGLHSPSGEARPDPSDLTQDFFWKQHGHKFDPALFPRASFDTVWQFAEAHSAGFERHNFDHAKESLWAVMELTDYCEANSEEVDRIALVLASLTHDNGVGENYEALGFDSEEEYAAFLCGESASSLEPKLPGPTIETAQQAILGTALDAQPEALESKIMANGDLQNVGEDYETSFLPVTKMLWREYARRYQSVGKKANDILFIKASIAVLNKYIGKDLSLGPFDHRTWHDHARQNIDRLNREFQSALSLARRAPAGIGSVAVRTVIDRLPLKDKDKGDDS